MKLGVSSYSYGRLVRQGQFTQLEAIALAAKTGFDFIEFAVLDVPEGEDILDYAKRVRAECERVGLAMGNYTIGADFINGSGGDVEAEARRLFTEVDVAVALGAPGMRHDVTSGIRQDPATARVSQAPAESFASLVPLLAKGCRMVTEYAAEHGIRTMSENHGRFSQDSERMEMLITAVDHPNYGALIDMGNFMVVDEDPAKAVGRLAPYAFHVLAKDFHFKSGQEADPGEGWFGTRGNNKLRGAIIGHGVVPVKQCLGILKQAGYTGDVAIEFEGMEDPLLGIRVGYDNLKAYLADLA